MLKISDLERNYKNLREFIYENKKIKSIENGILNGLNQLEFINLSKNEIANIDKLFLNSTDKIEVSYKVNQIKQYQFQIDLHISVIQNSLENLATINFSNNQIQTIHETTFNSLINLKYIDLSFNQLEQIGKQFQKNTNLNRINLSNNKISLIYELAFKGLKALNEINLFNNKYKKQYDLFLYLENSVQLINIENENENNLKNIFNIVKTGIYYRKIGLELEIVEKLFFHKSTFQKLQDIYLRSNNIETIDKFAFSELYFLHDLDLSRNKIKQIDRQAFHKLPNLTKINLMSNKLETIESDLFRGLVSLRFIDLRLNNLKFDPMNRLVLNVERNVELIHLNNRDDNGINPLDYWIMVSNKPKINLEEVNTNFYIFNLNKHFLNFF